MLQVGIFYQFEHENGTDRDFTYGTVLEWNFPLVQIEEDDGRLQILNLSTPSFVKAEPLPKGDGPKPWET
ncbi:hypothetical protein [Devosia sp.]|uniref:hypothetical protein n=1 Tax=Devosia sp. TaxID=1871048 RepID=UPI001AC3068D|nr:hypothetical protein [Devosia sp.]MBN9333634.1 hypothetical protein [Devosia sp.]